MRFIIQSRHEIIELHLIEAETELEARRKFHSPVSRTTIELENDTYVDTFFDCTEAEDCIEYNNLDGSDAEEIRDWLKG